MHRLVVVLLTAACIGGGGAALAQVSSRADAVNALDGKPLRYLIGTDASGPGRDDAVTEVSYDTTQPAKRGISIAYCNLFDEHNSGRYGPYLHSSDTAAEYHEGQIDPSGPGWEKNLREQFERRRKQGFEYVELDNPDAYSIKDVIGAIDLAASYGLKVIAKNPALMEGSAGETGTLMPQRHTSRIRTSTASSWSVAPAVPTTWMRCAARPASRHCRSGSLPSVTGARGPARSPAPPSAIATWA